MGEYLINAQGEDVVAGIRTPKDLRRDAQRDGARSGRRRTTQLRKIMQKLEQHYKYPQDVEFTVEQGKLWMLQTRNAKRTGLAGVRWAVEMATGKDVMHRQAAEEDPDARRKRSSSSTAATSSSSCSRSSTSKPRRRPTGLTTGLPAGPGAGVGKIVFYAHDAEAMVKTNKDEKVILVRHETSPEDVGGMWAAQGILTSTGGMTSHAAVVARGWGKCCIAGASDLHIDYKSQDDHGRRHGAEGRRLDQPQRLDRHGLRRPDPDARPARWCCGVVGGNKEAAEAPDLQDVQADLRLGRRVPQDEGPHQRRHAEGCRRRPASSAPRASASAAPSTCSSRATASGPSASSSWPRTRPAREKALAKLLPLQRERLRGHLQGDGRPAGHHPPDRSAAA